MATSIQFHALPEELLIFTQRIAEKIDAHLIGKEFPPLRRYPLDRTELPQAMGNPMVTGISFCFCKTPEKHQDPASWRDDDAIALEIARPEKEGLRQSLLALRSTQADAKRAWKFVSSELKEMTHAGVTVVNLMTGASTSMAAFRFTDGARALAAKGVAMLPIAGKNAIRFDSLSTE